MKKPNRVRKPRNFMWDDVEIAEVRRWPNRNDCLGIDMFASWEPITSREARRLAAWLIRAAEYLEQEKRDEEN